VTGWEFSFASSSGKISSSVGKEIRFSSLDVGGVSSVVGEGGISDVVEEAVGEE
jgi:hypothetical protein